MVALVATLVLLTGDSLAVGAAGPMRHEVAGVRVEARVGAGSREGLARMRRIRAPLVAVSLGANDPPTAAGMFERRVRAALVGRECVAWALIPSRPAFDRALRRVARDDDRLELVAVDVGSDGVHPTPVGYRRLAARFVRALGRCV